MKSSSKQQGKRSGWEEKKMGLWAHVILARSNRFACTLRPSSQISRILSAPFGSSPSQDSSGRQVSKCFEQRLKVWNDLESSSPATKAQTPTPRSLLPGETLHFHSTTFHLINPCAKNLHFFKYILSRRRCKGSPCSQIWRRDYRFRLSSSFKC